MENIPLNVLLKLLDLEQIEHNIFRGTNRDIGSGRVFGGQVLAQALVAAGHTVEGRIAHSLHSYFILAGDVKAPIVYDVDRIRDGRSFTTRRVVAIQHGRPIFNMSVSFQIEEAGHVHQTEMPEVPAPETLQPDLERIRSVAHRIPKHLRGIFTQDRPIDFRTVDPVDRFNPKKRPPIQHIWIRAEGKMPDDLLLHQAVLAYASDFGILRVALYPHGLSFMQRGFQGASLDHALWFHRPFRVDEWLLYQIESPNTGGARGFSTGRIFTKAGTLVASVTQEGLMRLRD